MGAVPRLLPACTRAVLRTHLCTGVLPCEGQKTDQQESPHVSHMRGSSTLGSAFPKAAQSCKNPAPCEHACMHAAACNRCSGRTCTVWVTHHMPVSVHDYCIHSDMLCMPCKRQEAGRQGITCSWCGSSTCPGTCSRCARWASAGLSARHMPACCANPPPQQSACRDHSWRSALSLYILPCSHLLRPSVLMFSLRALL